MESTERPTAVELATEAVKPATTLTLPGINNVSTQGHGWKNVRAWGKKQ